MRRIIYVATTLLQQLQHIHNIVKNDATQNLHIKNPNYQKNAQT